MLSGGGVRGAYEAGAVKGITEILELKSSDACPFQIFTGTSVGAINATYLAACAEQGDMAIDGLIETWCALKVSDYIQLDILRGLRAKRKQRDNGNSLIDANPLAQLIEHKIPFDRLHLNRREGIVKSLVVAALDIAKGKTTMFAQISDDWTFRPSHDPFRNALLTNIELEHVLASAALPFIFPLRKIGKRFYCDGGLRHNTPITPAIRSNANKIVIIPALRSPKGKREETNSDTYPNLTFVAGKLLNALLADPLEKDLAIVNRFNRLVEVLDSALTPEERKRVNEVFLDTRGHEYRLLDTLTIRPSRDIGVLAGNRIKEGVGGTMGWFLKQVLKRTGSDEADWASYVLFDGEFAKHVIEMGKQDAWEMRDQIKQFFVS